MTYVNVKLTPATLKTKKVAEIRKPTRSHRTLRVRHVAKSGPTDMMRVAAATGRTERSISTVARPHLLYFLYRILHTIRSNAGGLFLCIHSSDRVQARIKAL